VGLGEGWEALVATEIIVQSQTGLGSFFQSFAENPRVTAFGILGFLILIFSLNKLIWIPLLDWGHKKLEE
jgi:ABC-type anion transport system duplicated permease subunit